MNKPHNNNDKEWRSWKAVYRSQENEEKKTRKENRTEHTNILQQKRDLKHMCVRMYMLSCVLCVLLSLYERERENLREKSEQQKQTQYWIVNKNVYSECFDRDPLCECKRIEWNTHTHWAAALLPYTFINW